MKNVGCSNESIRMQVNLMGDAPDSEMEWNEPFFRDCFDNVDKVVTWVFRKGNPFAGHQTIAQDFIAEKRRSIAALPCSIVWRPGLCLRFQ